MKETVFSINDHRLLDNTVTTKTAEEKTTQIEYCKRTLQLL